ncbi:MAG: class I SAM-dependent methyltransferase [Candidatus Omnitrophota bacterium]|nr:class I SAM-dependent methyltransferase [Candidatus Omnitrophota bacterium]
MKKFIKKKLSENSLIRKGYYLYLSLNILTEWYVKCALKAALKGREKETLNILDAGVGFGQYSYYLSRAFPRAKICAVDIDKSRIENFRPFINRENLNIETRHSDLVDLQQDNQFDLILCTDVLEHIEKDNAVVATFFKALKRDGILIVGVPASPQKRVLPFLRNADFFKPHSLEHVREGYALSEITGIIEKNKLKIIDTRISFGKLGALGYELFCMCQFRPLLFLALFPLYFLFVQPLVTILMILDVAKVNKSGNGIIIVAKKV